jgi:hypothetical protein
MTVLESPALLHNMSAPPRALITFRPIQPADRSTRAGEGPGPGGLRWCCRVDVLNYFWPIEPGLMRDVAEGVDWDQTREPERRLLAQAIAEERGWAQPDAELASDVEKMHAEAVFDALCDVARRLDVRTLALPRIGLLVPASYMKPRAATPSMRTAVAILARRRGTVFGRDFDPLPIADLWRPVDLWEPSSLRDEKHHER